MAGPAQPAEYATAGVAELSASPVGRVSPSAMPDCAGLPAPLVSVKTSVVVAPSLIEAAPNVFAALGCTTASDWLVTPLFTPLEAVIWAAPLTEVPSVGAAHGERDRADLARVDRDARSP